MATCDSPASSSPGWVRRALIGRRPKRTLIRAGLLVAICILVRNYFLLPIRVEGASMLPTYGENAVNFVNRLGYLFHEPQRGDVVAIRLAGEHLMYMKRIVALPGETIAFRAGRAYINGKPLDEPYVNLPCYWEREPETVLPGHYFVVGDNRSMNYEDHVRGQAQRKRILGKVLL